MVIDELPVVIMADVKRRAARTGSIRRAYIFLHELTPLMFDSSGSWAVSIAVARLRAIGQILVVPRTGVVPEEAFDRAYQRVKCQTQ